MNNLSGGDASKWNKKDTEPKTEGTMKESTETKKQELNISKELKSLEKIYSDLTEKYSNHANKDLFDATTTLYLTMRSLKNV